jgi:hypothetical protein
MEIVSEEFREMIMARLVHFRHGGPGVSLTSSENTLLNSLNGLPLDHVIPGWNAFMIQLVQVLSCARACLLRCFP